MKKLDLAPLLMSRYWVAILFAIALTLSCSIGGPVLAAGSAAPSIESNIKNSIARQLVSGSRRAFESGNRVLGITLLRQAEKAAPEEGWIHLLLGRALLQAYDTAGAERQLRQARRNGISDEVVLPSLFDAMIKRHEENKLLNEFPAPLSNENNRASAGIFSGRAMALLSLGRADEAAASMDRALSFSRDSGSLLARARIALQRNNTSLATKLIDEALQRDPRNGHVLLAKLEDLTRSNDDAAAFALSEKILKQFPGDVQTRATRIDIYLKSNQDGKAKSEFGALEARAPQARIVQYYRALFLSRANNYDAAWKIAQTLPPNFALAKPNYIVELSRMAVKSNHVEAGATILARALTYSPDQVDLRLRLAAVRMSQNNPHSALLVMGPIKDSNDPAALDIIGLAKLQTDDQKGALDALRRASQSQPQNPQITFHLVQALDQSGDRNAARVLLKKLLASGYKFEDFDKARALEKSMR